MKCKQRMVHLGAVLQEDTIEASDLAEAWKLSHPELADPLLACQRGKPACWVEVSEVEDSGL
jgi:hypothetical protein